MDLTMIKNAAVDRLATKLNKPKETPQEEPTVIEEAETPETPEVGVKASIEETPQVEESAMSERERALLKEVTRLKAERRATAVETNLGEFTSTAEDSEEEEMEVTRAEARLFTAWRNEALEELLEKYPQYKTDSRSWERFTKEYSDRVPELIIAKRDKIPVTKTLFKERLERVHRSLEDGSVKAREEGKKELLKAQSAAVVMSAGAHKSSQTDQEKSAPKKKILIQNKGGFESWINKK